MTTAICRLSHLLPMLPARQTQELRSRWELPPSKQHGRKQIRKWAIGVAASNQSQATLGVALDSLVLAGWEAPHLFLDGCVRVVARHERLPGVLRDPAIGRWPNYLLALAELSMQHPSAEAYLMTEADLSFNHTEPLRPYLERMLWPERRPCLVLLSPSSEIGGARAGWQKLRDHPGEGALAVIFPRSVLHEFLLAGCPPDGTALFKLNEAIIHWARTRRINIWLPSPDLARPVNDIDFI